MSTPRILVIDDDAAHLISARAILEEEGYEVFTHQRAFGSTRVAANLQPDLVLLDVNMPGLSGEDLVGILREEPKTRRIPLVFFSSNDEDALRRAVAKFGTLGYISKGNPVALRMRVAEFLLRSAALAGPSAPI
ncbi:MAG: response regulator [Thermoanaerobaculia bacterium]